MSDGAEEGTRTPTRLLPPAPQAGASANSATSACGVVVRSRCLCEVDRTTDYSRSVRSREASAACAPRGLTASSARRGRRRSLGRVGRRERRCRGPPRRRGLRGRRRRGRRGCRRPTDWPAPRAVGAGGRRGGRGTRYAAHHRTRAARADNRQPERAQHEQRAEDGRRLGQDRGTLPGAERRLAAAAAERRGDVAALALLQQNGQQQQQADDHVQGHEKPIQHND